MPRPANMLKLNLSGTLDSGQEAFTTSFWMTGYTEGDVTDASAVLLATSGSAVAFLAAAKALISTTDAYRALDTYFYPSGTGPATKHGHADVSVAGNGTSHHPLQTAAVMTLRTPNIGRSFRGRMYLPASGAPLTTSNQFDTTVLNPVVDALGSWLSVLSSAPTGPVVMSTALGSSMLITSVDADQRPDIQRRRAGKQVPGTRHSAPVT